MNSNGNNNDVGFLGTRVYHRMEHGQTHTGQYTQPMDESIYPWMLILVQQDEDHVSNNALSGRNICLSSSLLLVIITFFTYTYIFISNTIHELKISRQFGNQSIGQASANMRRKCNSIATDCSSIYYNIYAVRDSIALLGEQIESPRRAT